MQRSQNPQRLPPWGVLVLLLREGLPGRRRKEEGQGLQDFRRRRERTPWTPLWRSQKLPKVLPCPLGQLLLIEVEREVAILLQI